MSDKEYSVEKKSKRKRIIIENNDGTTEVIDSGIVITLEACEDKMKIAGKHCNTREAMNMYVIGLAHLVTAMADDKVDLERMFSE